MLDLGLAAFLFGLLALGFRRPFLWVLAYLYVDILAPQKISWFLLASLPISLIGFSAAFGGWIFTDNKRDSRFTWRQALMILLLVWVGLTTLHADYPDEALEKWSWVWKALVFAIFLPLTLRTRLRFEASVLVMVLTAGAIIIGGAIKTLATGGGYGELRLFVNDNTGLYEGSIISCVAIAIIPLIFWLARHGTVFPRNWMAKLFALALTFACLLIPVGTQARTGLLCIALLFLLSLRTVKNRAMYIGLMAVLGLIAIPFLPKSYTDRMNTIENHQKDESASTRVAVWMWTLDYVKDHPFGGGFEAYRSNKLNIETRDAETSGSTTAIEVQEVVQEGRAYHSSYFEMLGEQGWPGLAMWLLLQVSGVWQMELLRRRWRKRAEAPGAGETMQWQAPLANALQQAQLVYMLGSFFVGIAYQPFILMLIGLQCGLWTYLRRKELELTPWVPITERMKHDLKLMPNT
jgi:probable O-glycosylation ligase (exosortase A-associated)